MAGDGERRRDAIEGHASANAGPLQVCDSQASRLLKDMAHMASWRVVLPMLAAVPVVVPLDLEGAEQGVQFVVANEKAEFAFRHVSGATGERHFIETMGPGCAFVDYDGDGNLDIYMVNGHSLDGSELSDSHNVLFRGVGDGSFTDVTQQTGAGDRGYGMGVTAADYDNDGDIDLFVTNYGRNTLLRNQAGERFIDVTQAAGVGDEEWGVGAAFLDFDSDGHLDLYVANYVKFSLDDPREMLAPYITREAGKKVATKATGYPHPGNYNGAADVLYRNGGAGAFLDVTREAGVYNPRGKGMGLVAGDYDNDGDVDIYVGNDLTPNFLYRNDGGRFTDVALLTGVAYSEDGRAESSMGVDMGDYDGDGLMDLVVPNFQGETCTLYHNDGEGFFSDQSVASGLGAPTRAYVGWGVGFFDYDNDGMLDLFMAAGHVLDNVGLFDSRTSYRQRNFLFRNTGTSGRAGTRFRDVSADSGEGISLIDASRGVAFGDYDNDGDLDILIANCNDAAVLLRNDGGDRQHWLRVKTVGAKSNRDGIGARVELTTEEVVQIREVKSGSSLYSQSDLIVHFGLGSSTTVDRVSVRWPSGTVDTVVGVEADQIIVIREGVGHVDD